MSKAEDIVKIQKYVRAANYLSVTQIYLQDNFLLDRPLKSNDIKPKLFGHWGTCPGINFVYGHANRLIKQNKQSAVFVLGPGHGMPGLQANLFIEGTLGKYYDKAQRTEDGVAYVSKMFAWPYGFSSHCSPETPGLILEGGELGYSLASAYGAVLDNPDLMAICLIGDGEAETGAIATAWHANKLVDPATSGVVLPILHLNGLKISGPTIFGRMSDEELTKLFEGYGYAPIIVEGPNIDEAMYDALDEAQSRFQDIKTRAKNGEVFKPIYPMIILKSPKGWTTIKELRGKQIEGTINSHQVVMPTVRTDDHELDQLEKWLRSYKFDELFDKSGFNKDVLDVVPDDELLMGDNDSMFGHHYKPLKLPDPKRLEKQTRLPGEIQSNAMRMSGEYLKEVFKLNADSKNFRLMSPDETYSNRLDNVFEVTERGFVWPHEDNDKDISRSGRVMEMLSEHTMHGLAQGYVLTGRHAVFTTYEAFAQIFSSMAHMYQKFLKWVRKMPWRQDIPSITYLLTSTAWRQEHNGYSHQNPSFVSGMLEKHNDFIKAYYPVDDNSMLAVMEETLSSKNQMNIVTAGKTPEPRWTTYESSKKALEDGGLDVWDFASDKNPHVIVVGIGDYMTKEALAAVELVKKDAPDIRIRFVNILRLQAASALDDEHKPQIPNAEKYFTLDKPVIVNFHGYPEVMQSILFKVKNPKRFTVRGYIEEGGTTTPFDMQVRNKTDRYNLAIEILEKAYSQSAVSENVCTEIQSKYKKALEDHQKYIIENGRDPEEIENWQWSAKVPVVTYSTDKLQIEALKHARTIAFIGLSNKPERHSYRVAKYFQDMGYKIIPINPNIDETLGEKAYASLLDIPESTHIDIVDIFREPDEVIPHLREVVERGNIRTIWLAEGANSHEAEEFAEDYGLHMITNQCIMDVDKAYRHTNSGDSK